VFGGAGSQQAKASSESKVLSTKSEQGEQKAGIKPVALNSDVPTREGTMAQASRMTAGAGMSDANNDATRIATQNAEKGKAEKDQSSDAWKAGTGAPGNISVGEQQIINELKKLNEKDSPIGNKDFNPLRGKITEAMQAKDFSKAEKLIAEGEGLSNLNDVDKTWLKSQKSITKTLDPSFLSQANEVANDINPFTIGKNVYDTASGKYGGGYQAATIGAGALSAAALAGAGLVAAGVIGGGAAVTAPVAGSITMSEALAAEATVGVGVAGSAATTGTAIGGAAAGVGAVPAGVAAAAEATVARSLAGRAFKGTTGFMKDKAIDLAKWTGKKAAWGAAGYAGFDAATNNSKGFARSVGMGVLNTGVDIAKLGYNIGIPGYDIPGLEKYLPEAKYSGALGQGSDVFTGKSAKQDMNNLEGKYGKNKNMETILKKENTKEQKQKAFADLSAEVAGDDKAGATREGKREYLSKVYEEQVTSTYSDKTKEDQIIQKGKDMSAVDKNLEDNKNRHKPEEESNNPLVKAAAQISSAVDTMKRMTETSFAPAIAKFEKATNLLANAKKIGGDMLGGFSQYSGIVSGIAGLMGYNTLGMLSAGAGALGGDNGIGAISYLASAALRNMTPVGKIVDTSKDAVKEVGSTMMSAITFPLTAIAGTMSLMSKPLETMQAGYDKMNEMDRKIDTKFNTLAESLKNQKSSNSSDNNQIIKNAKLAGEIQADAFRQSLQKSLQKKPLTLIKGGKKKTSKRDDDDISLAA
jgi:hypothetical protein